MSHLGRRGIKGEKKVDLFAAFGVFLACVACCMVMRAIAQERDKDKLFQLVEDTGRMAWSK